MADSAGAAVHPVELRSDRLLLRPFRPDDAPAVHAACQDDEIARWTTVPSPYAEADAAAFVERAAPVGWADGSDLTFVGEVNGVLVGSFWLHLYRPGSGNGEIGYWVAQPARGRGLATEAVGLVTRYGIVERGLDRVEILHAVGNTASCRVAARAGYPVEAVLRAGLAQRGERVDAELHALVAADWLDERASQLPVLDAGEGVRLRAWRTADAPALAAICADPDIPRYTLIPPSFTEDAARAWIARGQRRQLAGGLAAFAIVTADGALLGSMGVGYRDGVGDIGYFVAAGQRRRGVATRALRALAGYAVDSLPLVRLQLRTHLDNVASQRVAAAAGFRREGMLRSAARIRDARVDLMLFARLPGDLR